MSFRHRRSVVLTELTGLSWMPKPWRRSLLTLAGARIGSAPGRNFSFAGVHDNLRVGQHTYMNRRVFIEAVAPVEIGDHCQFGMESMVLTSHHSLDSGESWSFSAVGRPVSIGDRVWVGARAIVLPGAVIESNVVVAAGAVVTGRCAANGVYGGVPARRISELSALGEDVGGSRPRP